MGEVSVNGIQDEKGKIAWREESKERGEVWMVPSEGLVVSLRRGMQRT